MYCMAKNSCPFLGSILWKLDKTSWTFCSLEVNYTHSSDLSRVQIKVVSLPVPLFCPLFPAYFYTGTVPYLFNLLYLSLSPFLSLSLSLSLALSLCLFPCFVPYFLPTFILGLYLFDTLSFSLLLSLPAPLFCPLFLSCLLSY